MTANISRRTFLAGTATSAAAAAALGLAGCGSSDVESEVYGSADGYAILTTGDNEPFSFTTADGDPTGIEPDLVFAALEAAEAECNMQIVSAEEAADAIDNEEADAIIACMAISEENMETYDFSDSYYDSYVCAASQAGGEVTSLDAAKKKQVAVKSGSRAADWAESMVDEYKFDIVEFDTSEEAYEDVTDGDSVLAFDDFPTMAYNIQEGNGLIIVATEAGEYSVAYGLAVKAGANAELIESFNAGLVELRESGEYDEIVNKYLS